jgi:hypothetical protein
LQDEISTIKKQLENLPGYAVGKFHYIKFWDFTLNNTLGIGLIVSEVLEIILFSNCLVVFYR